MIAKKNNKIHTRPSQASPLSRNKPWDNIRIGYLCLFSWLMITNIYTSWTQNITPQVIPWYVFFIQPLLVSVAIIFAGQLQIEKRTPNTSMWQHLGLRWQGINLKKVGLCTFLYLVICYLGYVTAVEKDQLDKKSAETALAAIPHWKRFIATIKEMFSTTAVPVAEPGPTLAKPWWGIWMIGLVICVLGPITEEMLFRGILINELHFQGVYPILVQVVSAILFTIAHGQVDWYNNVSIFLLGMLFAWLRQRTGALFIPIWAHIVHNTRLFIGILYLLSHQVTLLDAQFVKTIKHYYGGLS
ncbi:MAG: CPBP family intramembrane glutamic endopeptidase [Bacteroidota bacterium]